MVRIVSRAQLSAPKLGAPPLTYIVRTDGHHPLHLMLCPPPVALIAPHRGYGSNRRSTGGISLLVGIA